MTHSIPTKKHLLRHTKIQVDKGGLTHQCSKNINHNGAKLILKSHLKPMIYSQMISNNKKPTVYFIKTVRLQKDIIPNDDLPYN